MAGKKIKSKILARSYWIPLAVSCFLILFSGSKGLAQPGDGIEISGLLIEETLTRGGRDFFYFFNSNWQSLNGNFTIKVKERQDRGSSTSILIFINDTVVYQNPLSRLPDALEESAKDAVVKTRNYILYQKEALKELDYY